MSSRFLHSVWLALIFAGRLACADGPDPGHSLHGEAFDQGPRQAAVLMEGTGKVNLPITTRSALAQKFFNQGVGQLHGFWFFEAERSFRQVAALDTNCAMAYWGMAMANANNDKRARQFIKIAVTNKARASRREQMWIDGLAAFYADGPRDKKQRERNYVRSLHELAQAYPNELEAKAILAWKLWDLGRRAPPYETTESVNALISQVLAVEPMHPAHHFCIHLLDRAKDAPRALESAALCGQSAPAIAHMWHMPGHTFSKLERYADAAWQQEASARVDHAHLIRFRVLPDQIHNYAHNNEWLIRDLSHIGRVHDAVDLAMNMIELPRHPQYNTLQKRGSSSAYGRARLFDVLARYELWDDLLALGATMYLEPTTIPAEQIKRAHALGLAHFQQGNVAEGQQQLLALEDLASKEKRSPPRAETPKDDTLRSKEESAGESRESAPPRKGRGPPRGNVTESALAELRGLLALARDRKPEARRQFGLAREVPKERLAQHYLALGDPTNAVRLAREAVNAASKQVQPLANYVEVLFRSGKTNEAKGNLNLLRSLSGHLDAGAPIFRRLDDLAVALKLPRAWQQPAPKMTDVGRRPELDTLGPLRWHPAPAPEWSLPESDGKTLSLAQYRGRPVMVIFYLGYGCLHCIEQLNAFAPLTWDFSQAGISLVAVSTDSVAGLKRTLAQATTGGGFPFPLVSDQQLKVFKAYRAYDDFEKMPLHGTFLIDGEGLVRWQDISYQPFTETQFLLAEAQRLLQVPKPLLTQTTTKRIAAH